MRAEVTVNLTEEIFLHACKTHYRGTYSEKFSDKALKEIFKYYNNECEENEEFYIEDMLDLWWEMDKKYFVKEYCPKYCEDFNENLTYEELINWLKNDGYNEVMYYDDDIVIISC